MNTSMAQLSTEWTELSQKMESCTRCLLRASCSRVVVGSGNSKAKILFVGEAPGKKEDENGVPFVGASGKLLDALLASIALTREDVYVTNIVKCRPPKNRDPSLEEIRICSPWLTKQLLCVRPQLVVTLGRHALHFFLPHLSIAQAHGKTYREKLPILDTYFSFFAAYHPAAALYNGKLRETLFLDFAKIPEELRKRKKR